MPRRLPQPTNVTQEIWQTADQMFAERLPARRLHIRLLGVGMSGFDHPAMVQLSLFPEAEHERQSRLDEVADQIKEKFGQAGLQRALGMLHNVEHRVRAARERIGTSTASSPGNACHGGRESSRSAAGSLCKSPPRNADMMLD